MKKMDWYYMDKRRKELGNYPTITYWNGKTFIGNDRFRRLSRSARNHKRRGDKHKIRRFKSGCFYAYIAKIFGKSFYNDLQG
jgi:hypothetical protein